MKLAIRFNDRERQMLAALLDEVIESDETDNEDREICQSCKWKIQTTELKVAASELLRAENQMLQVEETVKTAADRVEMVLSDSERRLD